MTIQTSKFLLGLASILLLVIGFMGNLIIWVSDVPFIMGLSLSVIFGIMGLIFDQKKEIAMLALLLDVAAIFFILYLLTHYKLG